MDAERRLVVLERIIHAQEEWQRGIKEAETQCWNCGADHARIEHDDQRCDQCGKHLIPF